MDQLLYASKRYYQPQKGQTQSRRRYQISYLRIHISNYQDK